MNGAAILDGADARRTLRCLATGISAFYIEQEGGEAQTAISRYGQEAKQYEPLRRLIQEANLPADMPIEEAVRHLEGAFGQGDATARMRELAESYQRDYEPLKGVLDQFQDVFSHYNMPPHEAVAHLLNLERALRQSPEALASLAQAYGHTLPMPPEAAQQFTALQQQLTEVTQRKSRHQLDAFMQDKPYFSNDVEFQRSIAAEMRNLQREAPGLKGTALLKLAHDNVAERSGVTQKLKAQQEAEQHQKMAARDAEWQQFIARRDAERDEWLRKESERKTRDAKLAASVNTRGSPGHARNPKTMDATLREIAAKHYN